MDRNELNRIAADTYDAQYTTVNDYPSPEAYADALIELGADLGWWNELTESEVEDLRAIFLRRAENDQEYEPKRPF